MSNNKKSTSEKVATNASKVLNDKKSSKIAKSLVGSALSQTRTKKQTGSNMEKIATKVLNSNKYSKSTKSLAGSVLSQSNKQR